LTYAAAEWIDLTLAGHKGQFPGPVEFIKTMRRSRSTGRADQCGSMRRPRARRMFGYDKDELWNTGIKTYLAVGTFWTYP